MVLLSSKTSRRSLLKIGRLGIVAVPLLYFSRVLGFISHKSNQQLPKIGLQLNSVQKELRNNPKDTLKQISFMGFAGFEIPYMINGMSFDDYGKMLKKFNLEIIAIHTELPLDQERKDDILMKSKIFKCNRIIWHGQPEDIAYKSEEGIAQLAQKYNAANQFARSNGLVFGIHNHWWEFEKLQNGKLPFDLLLEHLDRDIFFELDVYWIAVSGQDPVDIIRKLGPRAPILQVKDGPAVWIPEFDDPFPDPVLSVGTGKMDYPAIFEASHGNVEWIIVDIEACKTDIIQAIFDSYRYIAGNRFGVGLK
jgi:sugar phosphate isomerase/epimerase